MTDAEEIDSMCLTWRHDFGLMDADQRFALRAQMRQIYQHHVLPAIAAALRKDAEQMTKLPDPIQRNNELADLAVKWLSLPLKDRQYAMHLLLSRGLAEFDSNFTLKLIKEPK